MPLLVSIPGITHSRPEEGGQDGEKLFPFLDPLSDIKSHREGAPNKPSPPTEVDGSFSKLKVPASEGKFITVTEPFSVPYRTEALVELVDMFPTLAEAAGLPTLPLCPKNPFKIRLCTEGASLMPLIRNVTMQASNKFGHNLTKELIRDDDQLNVEINFPALAKDSKESSQYNIQSNGVFRNLQGFSQALNFTSEHKIQNMDGTVRISDQDFVLYKAARKCDPHFVPARLHRQSNGNPLDWKQAVFSQYPRPSVEPELDSDEPHLKNMHFMGYSVWTPDIRYTEWARFTPGDFKVHWSHNYGRELYLRHSDPHEAHNLALFEWCRPLVEEMSKRLRLGWRHSLPA